MMIHSQHAQNIIYHTPEIEIKGGLLQIFKEVKNTSMTIAYFAIGNQLNGKIKVIDYNIEPDIQVVTDFILGYTP